MPVLLNLFLDDFWSVFLCLAMILHLDTPELLNALHRV